MARVQRQVQHHQGLAAVPGARQCAFDAQSRLRRRHRLRICIPGSHGFRHRPGVQSHQPGRVHPGPHRHRQLRVPRLRRHRHRDRGGEQQHRRGRCRRPARGPCAAARGHALHVQHAHRLGRNLFLPGALRGLGHRSAEHEHQHHDSQHPRGFLQRLGRPLPHRARTRAHRGCGCRQ